MSNGTISIPQAMAAGVKDAHVDTLHSIIMEIMERVPDPRLDAPTVTTYLNRAFLDIVSRLAARGVYLPSLATTGEVETTAGSDVALLPADWFGCLHGAVDVTTGRPLTVSRWTTLQRHRGQGPIRVGNVFCVAVYGQRLRYWMVPSSPRRIALQYIRRPHPLVANSDKPFDLPVEFTPRMLADYACAEAFSNCDSAADFTVQINNCRSRFLESVDVLALDVGPWPMDAEPITDVMGWW